LSELEPVHSAFEYFVENGVGIVVKTLPIRAGIENRGVSRAADSRFGRAAVVDAAGIARGNRGLRAFATHPHDLRSEKNLPDAIRRRLVYRIVNSGLGGLDELEAPRNGEFTHFVVFDAGGEFGRVGGAECARLKLPVADRRKRGGIRHGGTGGIRFRLVRFRVRPRIGLRALVGGWRRLTVRPAPGERYKLHEDQESARQDTESPRIPSLAE
jgi:hypothetical protein